MPEQRNLILAIVISALIMYAYYTFFAPPPPIPPSAEQQEGAADGDPRAPSGKDAASDIPDLPGTPSSVGKGAAAAAALPAEASRAGGPRVRINTPRLHGSIALIGGRLNDLTMADYRETLDPRSPEIVLLTPASGPTGYYAEFGWVAVGDSPVPGPDTPWTASRRTLTPDRPVILSWDNGAGLRFERTYAVDQDYMLTVTQVVKNGGGGKVTLHPFGLIARRGTPEVTQFFILHEGMLGVFDGVLSEVDYDEAQEAVLRDGGREIPGVIRNRTTGGWLGFTDKYWLTALIPDQDMPVETRFVHRAPNGNDRYQSDYRGPGMEVARGGNLSVTSRLFAGAKEVTLLDRYEETLEIPEFWRAIDFGWFWFLTKPIFHVLIYINEKVGNFGISILLLTVMIKLIFFPLANKSYRSMSKLKKLQPEMVKLRERFGEDKMRLNQEMMALYKKEGANPASGCLPMVIQIPVFFALYKVLFVTIEMRQAPFYGWIQDLSQPDPTSIFNLFGLLPFSPPDFLLIGIWPLIMGGSMFLQQKLNPQPADPIQAKVFLMMPIVFTFLLARFPAGLVIYWAWNNALSILQQWVIMKRMGVSV